MPFLGINLVVSMELDAAQHSPAPAKYPRRELSMQPAGLLSCDSDRRAGRQASCQKKECASPQW